MIKIGIFIGGDTSSLNYSFDLKVANSLSECPMRLFKGSIDVNNPPSPFTYPQQISDFSLKVSGSTTENPNVYKYDSYNSLRTPTSFINEGVQASYTTLGSIDGSYTSGGNTSINGYIAQQLFSFNLIEIFQRAYGTIPGSTDTASKVAWLKNSGISSVTVNYYGYGSGPSGNKVYLKVYYPSTPSWVDLGNSTNSVVTNIMYKINGNIYDYMDSNGLVHYLVSSDPSNGTIPSVVNTDFISLTISYKDQSSIVWWKEETSQSVLDKLKAQNEIPITSVDFTNRTAIINGKPVVLQSDTQPAVRDDFLGKISGSLIENPNIAKIPSTAHPNTLLAPTGSFSEVSGTAYDKVKLNDGTTFATTITYSGDIPQQLYSFDIIRMLEDKFGSLPCPNDLASKIAYAKANISKIIANAYIYGVGPLGNKATLSRWRITDNSWETVINNSGSTPTLCTSNPAMPLNYIDSNGMASFLAYADAARTTDSTLLVLSGHGLSQYDIVENTSSNNSIATVGGNGGAFKYTANTIETPSITGQTSGNIIKKYHKSGVKNSETGTNSTNVVITAHGLSTGDYVKNTSINATPNKVTVIDTNTFTVATAITGQSAGNSFELYPLSGTQTAESTIISSTIYTDYISLDIQLKPTVGYDLLVPSNPRRDSVTGGNYDNCILAEKVYNSVVSDYTGKVFGDLVANPSIAKHNSGIGTTLGIPSSFSTEFSQSGGYDKIKTLNSDSASVSTAINLNMPQILFQFPLISIFEKTYGTINATDKLSWLKSNISSIRYDWTGYGSCPTGNKAYTRAYDVVALAWGTTITTNTANTPTLNSNSYGSSSLNYIIDSNGVFNLLCYTDASDGNTASTIFTDYIKLTITFSNGNNALEYFTNNSVEIATQTTSKATSYLIEADLSPICTALYGGSNAALKAGLKAIQADIWASGYSALSNDVVNGTKTFVYTNAFVEITAIENASSAIVQKTWLNNTVSAPNYVTASNKIYILVTSTNNSTVDIPSVVNLDYLNIRVDLARSPDVISNPPTITLTPTWSMLLRGFSPAYAFDGATSFKNLFTLVNGTNTFALQYHTNKCFRLYTNAGTITYTNTASFSKYQITNILIKYDGTNIVFYGLKNNGTFEKISTAATLFTGLSTLNLLMDSGGVKQADAFLDSIAYIPNVTYDDIQAEAILRGTQSGFTFNELFDINAATLLAGSTRSNNVIYSTVTTSFYANTGEIYIPVLPNNQYELKATMSGNTSRILVYSYYNNILLDSNNICALTSTGQVSFTVPSKCNKIAIRMNGNVSNAMSWSNISLKIKM